MYNDHDGMIFVSDRSEVVRVDGCRSAARLDLDHNFANASALKAALLENYDLTQPPPRANSTRGVVVRVQFALQQFTQLDTTNQRITFFIAFCQNRLDL